MSNNHTFITKAKLVHGDKYDYSLVEYKHSKLKVKIICPTHGEFLQTPNSHLNGSGCKNCGNLLMVNKRKKPLEKTITKAKLVHGDKYDYSLVEYKYSNEKVKIICPVHGVFEQTWVNHCRGHGCVKCAATERSELRKFTTNEFVTRSESIHGGKYDYSLVNVDNYRSKVKIICPIHGVFEQVAEAHYSLGCGCNKCGIQSAKVKRTYSTLDFINKAKQVHGDLYDYSLVEYTNNQTHVKIICPIHGDFEQSPNGHIDGNGCQKCSIHKSSAEDAICEKLDELNVHYIRGDRSIIKPHELDVYIPSKQIAIEYNGLIWHSERFGKGCDYHKLKTDKCKTRKIRLIHIWEDDFLKNPDREIEFILHQLGLSESIKIHARKTKIVSDVNKVDVKKFMERYHVQGHVSHSESVSLVFNGEIVAVGCFTRRGDTHELVRYASSYTVVGGLGKVVKAFGKPCYTFCDNSRFTGDSYIKAGFVKSDELKPDYSYLVNDERQHKFLWRKKLIAKKLPHIYSDDLTEKQMMELAKIPRIWDCGKTRFEYCPPLS